MLPVVAIVGRPNVGKSTLFNRIVGRRKALVHDRPGVTRDRNYSPATWDDREFILVDTGGFDPDPQSELSAAMRRQSEAAIAEADAVVLVMDGPAGITPADLATATLIRQGGKPVVVAVNKCDENVHDALIGEFWELGFDEVLPVSAEHGRGLWELLSAVVARLPPVRAPEPEVEGEIRIAVLGRPNVGKSTLVNRLVGEERHVVDAQPGTTMDATDSVFLSDGQRFRLIGLAVERGRAIVLLVNKWDAVRETEDRNIAVLEDEFSRKLPHATYAPVLYIAARTGKGCHRILPLARSVYESFNSRVTTARLNEFLRAAVAAHSPPQLHNHPIRYQYMTQVRVRPPTFCVFVNNPKGVVQHYDRYLKNKLREQFGFFGTPLRIEYRRRRRLGEARTDEMGGVLDNLGVDDAKDLAALEAAFAEEVADLEREAAVGDEAAALEREATDAGADQGAVVWDDTPEPPGHGDGPERAGEA